MTSAHQPRLLDCLLTCVLVSVALLAACATPEPISSGRSTADEATLSDCRDLILEIDRRVARAGVADAESARVTGFPYLRVDRLLASSQLRPTPDSSAFDDWVLRMRGLDQKARGFELANLSGRDPGAPASATELGRIESCANRLAAADLADPSARRRLLESARVPDDYNVAARVIGLYPFTSVPFRMGVDELHEQLRADFSGPLAALPVHGRLVRYVPPSEWRVSSPTETRTLLRSLPRDHLGIPRPREEDVALLAWVFAPTIEVDEVSEDDRIGAPAWMQPDAPSVDVRRPTVYWRVSHTRFGGATLFQLNYTVWFPARTSTGALDLLAGHLDGLTFRITFGEDGQPLIYDSMHNCGCYHLFLLGPSLEQRPPPRAFEEPPLVVHSVEAGHGRPSLRLSHGNHYLQRLRFDAERGTGVAYVLKHADTLRSLPLADGGRRSLYAPDGLVPGTERAERWLFWPMGVPSPGAMRQWGHHAIAFVGTRHFDDPDLIERYFTAGAGNPTTGALQR